MSKRFPTKRAALQRAGQAIELVRVRRGYARAEVADAVGWSVGRLKQVEAGGRTVTWLDVLDVLTALDASIEDLTAAWSEVGETRLHPPKQRIKGRS